MSRTVRKTFAVRIAAAILAATLVHGAQAATQEPRDSGPRQVDLAIALDVSGSMSGLIESTKQRLWDIVNELGRAQPTPQLRVAIVSYGNPSYGANSGFVSIDQPFTGDLDAVNETLFAFGTNGGDEYVARVIHTSAKALQWSTQEDALRIVFVAGNESALQDPQISLAEATRDALGKGIVINAIYCGSDNDQIAPGWRNVAQLGNGIYASIDQDAAAVANIATPMDQALVKLNEELNETYVAFGRNGKRHRENQAAQDENAARMSAPAAASRAVTKAGALYNNADWDLVDALKSGKDLEEFEIADLPPPMRAMDKTQRHDYVKQQAERRAALKKEIRKLDEQRRDYVTQERARMHSDSTKGLDEVIQSGLRAVAKEKGFTFGE